MTDQQNVVVAEVEKADPTAKDIHVQQLLENLEGNSVYYADFTSTENPEPDNFYYVLVHSNGKARLFDDGVRAIEGLALILDQKKAAIQKLKDFWFVEIVGALLAVSFTVAFIIFTVRANGTVDDKFVGIVAIILGYYFGKNVTRGN